MSARAESPPAEPLPTPRPTSRGRTIAVWALVVLAALLLLLSFFAVWVNRVALNTDVFVDTSSELIADDEIRGAISTRAVDSLFESVNVQADLEEQLPPDYQRLSGPATAALREAAYRIVDEALQRPALQRLWAISVEQSHRTLVEILEGGGDRVSTEEGVVTLDLEAIVLEAADRIGLRDQVAGNLPEDVGQIEILRAEELDAAQTIAQLLKVLAWLLPILALAAFALAMWISRNRRRTLRRIGFAVIAIGIVGLVAVGVVGNYIVNELVADTENRTAARNAWDILTELLRSSFWWAIPLGVILVVASWLAGPGPRAVGARRYLAPALAERVWPYLALAAIAIVLLLTGPVSDVSRYLVVAVLIALGAVGIEVLRRQTMQEFPGATRAEMFDEARARLSGWWDTARRPAASQAAPPAPPPPPPAPADVTGQLTSLSELHASGRLTDEEYAAAKGRVLVGG